jgi:hypothetical protein
LLAGRQRFASRSNAVSLLLKLFYPLAQRQLNQPERASYISMAVALIEPDGGLTFELRSKRKTLFGL